MGELATATVQFNHMKGKASLDFYYTLRQMAKVVNAEGYPFSMQVHLGGEGAKDPNKLTVCVYTVAGIATDDELASYFKQVGNKVPDAKMYEAEMTLEEFRKVVKRFNVLMYSEAIGGNYQETEIEFEPQ